MAGDVRINVTVEAAPLDLDTELATIHDTDSAVGAVVTFVGLMREFNDGDRVTAMTLEHYPGMTEKALEAIADEAVDRWQLQAVRIVHRHGELRPTDPIVIVAVASAHRGDAFLACEFLIDYLKTRAPFWKCEVTAGGDRRWVEARHSDTEAAGRWRTTDPAQQDA